MVDYTRFLKAPHIKLASSLKATATINALITITSDLGDEFYPDETSITSYVYGDSHGEEKPLHRQIHTWKAGGRALPLQHRFKLHDARMRMRLLVTTQDGEKPETYLKVTPDKLPMIIPAWSGSFGLDNQVASKVVERRLQLPDGQLLRIQEESGESIARHIW